MNLLDLVPALKRQLKSFIDQDDTDSHLAAYLADAVEALSTRWIRTYAITYTAPNTYEVSPDITSKDKRPIIVMASIIYKIGNDELASWRDGDFAWDPRQGSQNPIAIDIAELNSLLPPPGKRLAKASTAPMRGYSNVYNPESYRYLE